MTFDPSLWPTTCLWPLIHIYDFWSRFPIEEHMDEDSRLQIREDGSLQIRNVNPEDATTYSCRAYNGIGSATKTYTLFVQGTK